MPNNGNGNVPNNGNDKPVALLDAKEQWSALAAAAKPMLGEDPTLGGRAGGGESGKSGWRFGQSGGQFAGWQSVEATQSGQFGTPDQKLSGKIKAHGNWFFFFGVILPVLSMAFELSTHYCARHFFDPFPSAAHVILFSLIPLSNFLCWLSARRNLSRHYAFMALVSGMAMGIGVLYSLMFITLTPTLIWYLFSFGIGLLGLAPLLSLPCSYMSGKSVCAFAHVKKTYFDAHQVEHIGHLIVLIMVVAVELPSTLTRINLGMATDAENPQQAQQAIGWLRSFGSQEVMLRACYERSGRATDVLGTLYESHHPISVENARRVFYQVTGKPFNSVPLPASARGTIQHVGLVSDIAGVNASVDDEFDLDADIAGEAVSGIARGLSVKSSNLTGTIDANAATAKLQWKIAFQNTSKYDREARAKLLLPPGAIVTGAKIWMNNREADATIMVKSEAREMYRANIAARKDPLLVSTCGTDRILVQCFPVQPSADVVVTLSIAAPLGIKQDRTAALVLPAFEERNFLCDVSVETKIESTMPMSPVDRSSLKMEKDATDKVFSTKIDTASLSRFSPILTVERDANVKTVWCEDNYSKSKATVVMRELAPPQFKAPTSLTVIVDGSAAMQPYKQDIIRGLALIPKSISTNLVFVGDTTLTLLNQARPVANLGDGVTLGLDTVSEVSANLAGNHRGDLTSSSTEKNLDSALKKLESLPFVGGQDDAKALATALTQEFALQGNVLWVHGAQPVESGFKRNVREFLEQSKKHPYLYDLQVASGPNFILADVEGLSSVVRVPRNGRLVDDLETFFASLQQDSQAKVPVPSLENSERSAQKDEYNSISNPPAPGPAVYKTDNSLAQLYANRQITRLLENQATEHEAYQLANWYHFVSPVSSAIVTEQLVTYSPTALPEPAPEFEIPNLFELAAGRLQTSISTAFSSVVGQLNNLSAAAGPGSTYTSSSSGIVGAPVDPRYGGGYPAQEIMPQGGDGGAVGGYAGNAMPQAAPMSVAEPAPTDALAAKMRMKTAGDKVSSPKMPDAWGGDEYDTNTEAQFAESGEGRDMTRATPRLQGATNGTVGKDTDDASNFRAQSGLRRVYEKGKANAENSFSANPGGLPSQGRSANLFKDQERVRGTESSPVATPASSPPLPERKSGDRQNSQGPGTVVHGKEGPVFAWPVLTPTTVAKVPTVRDTRNQNSRQTVSDTQFQIIDRYDQPAQNLPPPPEVTLSTGAQVTPDSPNASDFKESEKEKQLYENPYEHSTKKKAEKRAEISQVIGQVNEVPPQEMMREPSKGLEFWLSIGTGLIFLFGPLVALIGIISVLRKMQKQQATQPTLKATAPKHGKTKKRKTKEQSH